MVLRMITLALLALVSPCSLAFAPIQEASCVASRDTTSSIIDQEDALGCSNSAAVITVEAFFDKDACQKYRETPIPSSGAGENRVGDLIVEPEHAEKMISTFERLGASGSSEVKTLSARHTYIETSTAPHHDRYAEGEKLGQLVTSNNAFVFLNSNPDANFVHGDFQEIPVVEGTLVVFDGSVSHHTRVRNGTVHLLGPLNTESLQRVGNSTNTTNTTTAPTRAPVPAPAPVEVPCEDGTVFFNTCIEFGLFPAFLMLSGLIGSIVLCSVGIEGNDS